MPKYKQCMYSLCQNNTYSTKPRSVYSKLIPFPRPRRDPQKCHQWISACGRFDNKLNIEKLAKKSFYICEEHFMGGKGPTTENPNPIPFEETSETLNLMNQSESSSHSFVVQNNESEPIPHISSIFPDASIVVEDVLSEESDRVICVSEVEIVANTGFSKLVNFQTLAGKRIPNNWTLIVMEEGIVLTKLNIEKGLITKSFSLKDHALRGVLMINGKVINAEHPLVKLLPDVINEDALFELLDAVDQYPLCTGIYREELLNHFQTKEKSEGYINLCDDALHSSSCEIIQSRLKNQTKNLETKGLCDFCTKYRKVLMNSLMRQKKNIPSRRGEKRLMYLQRDQLVKKIKIQTQSAIDLRKKVKQVKSKMKKDFKESGQYFCDKDSLFICEQLEKQKKMLPKNSFKRLFVEQQLSILKTKSKTQRRWHPKIIKWAIHMYKKSGSTYNAMVSSNMFELPSKRTLYNHSSHVGLKAGFTKDSFIQATEMLNSSCSEEHQWYVSVILDEMKIKEDIIYRANTGELVGFSNLDKTGNEILQLRNEATELPEVASHILQIMIRSITGNFKFPLAYFPCKDMNSDSLHRIVSEAISKLEFHGIKVLSIIADGASTNRKMYRNFVSNGYCWKNIYALDEERYIFFVCDPPHVLKTARNGHSNSNFHTKTKNLIKNGQPILWTHIVNLYDLDSTRTVKLVPKLTRDHVFLDSHSRMRVRLAAQVFSDTVANALELEFGDQCRETIKFIRIMNKFFDCMNVRNFKEGLFKRNHNLVPYKSEDDERLKWLEGPFIQYFLDWQKEVDSLPKSVSAADRIKMTLSRETIEGLLMTAKSVPAIIQFLLKKKAQFVLTSHINQDCLEQEFGKQRGSCGGNTNPDVLHFAQNVDRFKDLEDVIKPPKEGNTEVQNVQDK